MTLRITLACVASLTIAFLVAPSAAQVQRDDQIFLTKGTPARGKVVEIGRDVVKIEEMRGVRPIAVNEIVRIAFRDDPSELAAARTSIVQKNYNQALQDLKKLDGQNIANEFVRQDIEFYKALCLGRLAINEGGDKGAATTAMLNFVKAAPQSYHFYEAAEVLGDLAMASGKWADAAKYYTPIASAPWPDYQMRANNALGRALTAEKQYDQALEKFAAILQSELTTAEAVRQKNLATVGRAVCLAETGQVAEGISLLNDLIGKNDPQEAVLFARIYNALGKCHLKQNKPKDAVLAFLHTDVLFYQDADAHAEALYHLSKLWTEVNKSDRALAARSLLRERYAGSIWATQE